MAPAGPPTAAPASAPSMGLRPPTTAPTPAPTPAPTAAPVPALARVSSFVVLHAPSDIEAAPKSTTKDFFILKHSLLELSARPQAERRRRVRQPGRIAIPSQRGVRGY